MRRSVLGIVVGYVVWTMLWLGGGAGIQAAWPDALPAEGPITATGPLVLTLVLSVVCSLVAGRTAAVITHRRRRPVLVMALLLLATGIGVQASVWARMPLWFHLSFLVLIVPMCLLGAGETSETSRDLETEGVGVQP